MNDRFEVVTDSSWIDELSAEPDTLPGANKGDAQVDAADVEQPNPLPIIDAMGIFDELGPVPYLSREIDVCPGAPALIAGFGFSGKTVASQQIAVDVALGQPIWGKFAARQGRVLHVDFEQGSRLTRERYQRLARASLAAPQDLQGNLALSCLPPMYMDHKYAEEVLCHTLDGYSLCIIDSLRAAAPTIDENSSDIRRPLDMLHRVSERTECATLVIHHSRKPSQTSQGGAKMAIRGSGAIFDACSSVFSFDGESKGGVVLVSHHKARTSGILCNDFTLQISDVELDGRRRAGLSVAAISTLPKMGSSSDDYETRIIETVRTCPGLKSLNDISARTRGKRTELSDALKDLLRQGKLVKTTAGFLVVPGTGNQ